jgi:hypothetical protein
MPETRLLTKFRDAFLTGLMSEKFNIESPAFGVGLPPLAGGNT